MKTRPITIVGLGLAIFGILLVQLSQRFSILTISLSEQTLIVLGLISIWLLGLVLLVIIKMGEKQSLASVGFKAITVREILLAVIIGVGLSLMVPLLTLLVSQIIPTRGSDIVEVTSTTSWWVLLLSIFTAGIVEEFIFRGYIIERLFNLTGKIWLAVVISLIAFLLPHTLSWNIAHVIAVVFPLGLILSWLYVWKRNLIFNMIVHIVVDFPLFIMALLAT